MIKQRPVNNVINPLYENYSVALYDMNIEDVKERHKRRLVFEKASQAANFLGYIPSKFYERIGDGKIKKYAFHQTSKNKFAVRRITI